MLGIVYAGQGSQRVGMGQDFYEKYESFRKTIDGATKTVSAVTDMDVAKLCFEGPEEQLSQTKYTQPAIGGGLGQRLVEGLHRFVHGAEPVVADDDVQNLVAHRGELVLDRDDLAGYARMDRTV